MAALRADLVFSYWIFVWYVLYALKIIKYSPKFALLFGIIDNIILLFLMVLFGSNKRTIFYFILINSVIKVLPYYTLIKERIKISDIYFTGVLLLIFIMWLHINKQSLVGNIKLIHNSLIYNKNETPFLSLLEKIKQNFTHLEII
jgi:hypothetical protein